MPQWTPAEFFKHITPDKWNRQLEDINNWYFKKVAKQSNSPTEVFSIHIGCSLPGYELLNCYLGVDELDLDQKPFKDASDQEQAYVNYVREQFHFNQLHTISKYMAKYRQMLADNLRMAVNGNIENMVNRRKDHLQTIKDTKLRSATANAYNVWYDMKSHGFLDHNQHLDYRRKL